MLIKDTWWLCVFCWSKIEYRDQWYRRRLNIEWPRNWIIDIKQMWNTLYLTSRNNWCAWYYLVKEIVCNLRVKPRGYTPICVGNRNIALCEINQASCNTQTPLVTLSGIFHYCPAFWNICSLVLIHEKLGISALIRGGDKYCGTNRPFVRENHVFLWRRAYARNVRLYYPYRQYTSTFLYFDLYLNIAYAAHYVYFMTICYITHTNGLV